MKTLLTKARMVANVLHLGGRYEGASVMRELVDAVEYLHARLQESIATQNALVIVVREAHDDLRREREKTARREAELAKARRAPKRGAQ